MNRVYTAELAVWNHSEIPLNLGLNAAALGTANAIEIVHFESGERFVQALIQGFSSTRLRVLFSPTVQANACSRILISKDLRTGEKKLL